MDLTMISTAEVTDFSHFNFSCITGERNAAPIGLDIKRENKIFIVPMPPQFRVHRRLAKEVVATDFHSLGNIGIFYCEAAQELRPHDKIIMINNPTSGTEDGDPPTRHIHHISVTTCRQMVFYYL